MTSGRGPERTESAVDLILAAAADVATGTVGGVPLATASQTVRRYLTTRLTDAHAILLREIGNGKKGELQARDQDDLVHILYLFFEASIRGRARENLELLARPIVSLNDRDALYASNFDKHQQILADLDHDEIIILAHAARQSKQENIDRSDLSSVVLRTKPIAEISFDGKHQDVIAAASKALRTGYVYPEILVSGIAFRTAPKFSEIIAILPQI